MLFRSPRSIVEAAGAFADSAGLTVTRNEAVRDGDPDGVGADAARAAAAVYVAMTRPTRRLTVIDVD